MAVLILPLTVPVLIFGVAAAAAAIGGTVPFHTPFLILCALSLISIAGRLLPPPPRCGHGESLSRSVIFALFGTRIAIRPPRA